MDKKEMEGIMTEHEQGETTPTGCKDEGSEGGSMDDPEDGFDLNILRRAQVLGGSYASNLSILTEDDPFSLDDSTNWENDKDREGFDSTMQLLDRTMTDLQDLSMDEESRAAIGDAIGKIEMSMKEGRSDDIGEDLDVIRSHLYSKRDINPGKDADENLSKTLKWETLLSCIRAGTVLGIYCTWLSFHPTTSWITAKTAGVLVFCGLAAVPRRDELEATAQGFRVHLIITSRKTILLLVYVLAWVSLMDAAKQAWNDYSHKRQTDVSVQPKVIPRKSKLLPAEHQEASVEKVGNRGVSREEDLGTNKMDIVTILAGEKRKIASKIVDQDDRAEKIEKIASSRAKSKKEDHPEPVPKSKENKTVVESKVHHQDAAGVKERKEESFASVERMKKEVLQLPKSPAFRPSTKLRSGSTPLQTSHKEPLEPLKKALRGNALVPESVNEATSTDGHVSKKILLEHVRQWVRKAVQHIAHFLVGHADGHKSQHMLDILGELWMHRNWH